MSNTNNVRALTAVGPGDSCKNEFRKLKLRDIKKPYLKELGKLAYNNFNGPLVAEMEFYFTHSQEAGQ